MVRSVTCLPVEAKARTQEVFALGVEGVVFPHVTSAQEARLIHATT
jgi:2-keto-3-deoxy-L-rhamnonate aldolase RhmA